MNALQYTTLYQMTYLFIETFQGHLGKETVNDSLRIYLIDLEEVIKENEKETIEVIEDCIYEYFEPIVETEEETENVMKKLVSLLKFWDFEMPNIEKFFNDTLHKAVSNNAM